ncbi:hypothetical protein DMX10_13990 [Pseudomonas sp. 57B-090624]|uniref:hypothetical protein n=1 Tax=Pseudomonas sp. 57B-090624 TaxID=2213080 RepID=UPI000DA97BDC|nr:hypothetical protein [Pseudomonas sp. 57B-090624]PZE12737.1 hypothetical protein DMX10_13990 [Pseudomonas sp. 57B-090624]
MTGLSESATQRRRDAFERQARKRGLPISYKDGRYQSERTNRAWLFFHTIYLLVEQTNSEG